MDHFSDHIPLLRPWIDDDEIAEVVAVLKSGWVSQGTKVQQFEEQIARIFGAPHVVATNSATSALHLGLQVSGLQRGRKVLVPAHTCMATVNALLMAGGEPVFVDIDRRTFNIDPAAAEAAITDDVWGVLAVHQIGLPVDLQAFERLAARRNLQLVEDAATAFGAKYEGKFIGGHGNPVAFSLHPRKMITTGEGGLLVLWNDEAAERARRLRSAGASISDLVRHGAKGVLQQDYPEPGYNYRLTDLQAAVGLAQMRKFPQMLAQRTEQARWYDEHLAAIPGVCPPYVPAGCEPAYTSYCVTLPGASEQQITNLLKLLAVRGISCRRGIQPLYREPYFAPAYPDMYLPETEAVSRETIFLPIFPGLTREQQRRVVEGLTAAVEQVFGCRAVEAPVHG